MEAGTIRERYLENSILPRSGKTQNVELGPGVGNDYSLSVGILSAEGVGNTPEAAWRKAYGNFCCSLGICICARVIWLLPGTVKDGKLKAYREQFEELSMQYHIPILGGQTQILEQLTAPSFTVTLLGKPGIISPDRKTVQTGYEIVMAGTTGCFGACERIEQKNDNLMQHFSKAFLEKASEKLSHGIYPELGNLLSQERVLHDCGLAYMHDVSHGGIYNALWQIGKILNVGLIINNSSIPIEQETIELSECMEENPYLWDGTGAMLFVCRNGKNLIKELQVLSLPTAIIGKVTDGKERIVEYMDGEKRTLGPL